MDYNPSLFQDKRQDNENGDESRREDAYFPKILNNEGIIGVELIGVGCSENGLGGNSYRVGNWMGVTRSSTVFFAHEDS
jgi:hypothetical protein